MTKGFSLSDYDYHLPPHLIAQHPRRERTSSRLLILDRRTGRIMHGAFRSLLDKFDPGDCLVVNNTRVFPARLKGRKTTGGRTEAFLLNFPEQTGNGEASALALFKASKKIRAGQTIRIGPELELEVKKVLPDGRSEVRLCFEGELHSVLDSAGEVPLPPYIKRSPDAQDKNRYQTVYADQSGSVAAPTAGLHFSPDLLGLLRQKGVNVAHITLHVGYGTFAPIRTNDIREHRLHSERVSVPQQTVETIRKTQSEGGRVTAVGTTTVRSLEAAAFGREHISCLEGACDLYIVPGHRFRVVDRVLTNFHLPRSSLLVLVSAFAGRERVLSAYEEAVAAGYRFYSYGDAMLIE